MDHYLNYKTSYPYDGNKTTIITTTSNISTDIYAEKIRFKLRQWGNSKPYLDRQNETLVRLDQELPLLEYFVPKYGVESISPESDALQVNYNPVQLDNLEMDSRMLLPIV